MTEVVVAWVGVVVGLLLGGIGVWYLVRNRLLGLEGEVLDLRGRVGEVDSLRTRLEMVEGEKGRLGAELESLEAELDEDRTALSELRVEYGKLLSISEERESAFVQRLEDAKAEAAKREQDFEKVKAELKESFENLSSAALKGQMETFLQQSDELLKRYRDANKGEKESAKLEFEKLLEPMKETLGKLDSQNREMEKEREGAYRELRQQIDQLTGGTQKLIGALQGSASAGRFGELVLKRVVELAGMTERVTYDLQETIRTDDGKQRPDALVKLPGGRTIIIDAKAPVHELDSDDFGSEDDRKVVAKAVAGKVLEYAKGLGAKNYAQMEEAADYTVMFVASESAFRRACEGRPDLIEAAMDHNVIVATPSTLLALLKAVAYGWKQERLASEAREIQIQAKKLYDGLSVMMGHYETLGKRISDVGKAYNKFGGSLDRTVMPAARKFSDAGVGTQKEVLESAVVEFEPKELKAQDFSALPGIEGD